MRNYSERHSVTINVGCIDDPDSMDLVQYYIEETMTIGDGEVAVAARAPDRDVEVLLRDNGYAYRQGSSEPMGEVSD